MKIAVLDFNCNSVDIITVDEAFIEEKYNGEIEDFLTEHCQYNLDMIQWMGPIAELNLDMTEQSFEAREGYSQRKLASMFNVSKRLIQSIITPPIRTPAKKRTKEYWAEIKKRYRDRKNNLYKSGKIQFKKK